MLNGLIKPDVGSIEMHGRVGAMIALGAGFNPILTGRENIYIAASVLGFSKKEVDQRFDEIVEFAEISEFIDTPVQSYSSGMQVRLGFAVASSLDPDILLIDEVLAVGDVNFRRKCYNRIDKLREKCAVILVTHQMQYIGKTCSNTLVLNKGKKVYDGDIDHGIEVYNNLNEGDNEIDAVKFSEGITCNYCEIAKTNVKDNKRFNLSIKVEFKTENDASINENLYVHFAIQDKFGNVVSQISSYDAFSNKKNYHIKDLKNISCEILNISLKSGKYFISLQLLGEKTKKCYFWNNKIGYFESNFNSINTAVYLPEGIWL